MSLRYTYSDTGCSTGTCSGGAADKVIKEVTPLGAIDYTYDAIGRRTSMTVAGQPTVSYSYDANSRLTGINTTINNVASGFSLSYDAIGRRTSLILPNGVKTNYNYDEGSHLLELKHLNPVNAVLEALSYSYDATGNRTSMNRQSVTLPLPNGASNINYNEANQMLSFQPEAQSAKDMTYDENGNLTSITNGCGTTNYTWEVRNRLVGISGFNTDCSALSASFKYDTLGRRTEKTINGVTTQYVYDGLDIVQEIENGSVSANYIRTLNIDEPLTRVKADGTVRYYQQDALGSVIGLTDETGTVKTQYSYDPFGTVTVSGEASDNPFQHTGRENDNTGLYYYRARYYSPELQRFISEDPIRLRGGINFYSYVGNNPVNGIDPFGLKEAGYGGWEAQFILGYGEVTVTCCDGQTLRQLKYRKVCYGGGFTVGISSGVAFNSQGPGCKNPPPYVISTEFGFPLYGPLGVEGGSGFYPGGMSPFVGGSAGVGGKATVCFYWLVFNTERGCCN